MGKKSKDCGQILTIGMSSHPSVSFCLFICLNHLLGSVEKKQQRRSIRTRSESEKSTEVVPKKKIKKEQVGFLHVES
jgi:hypothetical protein